MTKTRKFRQRIPDATRKAIILAAQAGMNFKEIAETYQVSMSSVEKIHSDYRNVKKGKRDNLINSGSLQVYEETKKQLANMFQDIATRAGLAITDEKLDKSSAAQLIMISGTATDKGLLLRGEPTEIHSQLTQKPTRELIKEFRKRKLGTENNKDTDIILEHDGSMVVTKKVNDN